MYTETTINERGKMSDMLLYSVDQVDRARYLASRIWSEHFSLGKHPGITGYDAAHIDKELMTVIDLLGVALLDFRLAIGDYSTDDVRAYFEDARHYETAQNADRAAAVAGTILSGMDDPIREEIAAAQALPDDKALQQLGEIIEKRVKEGKGATQ